MFSKQKHNSESDHLNLLPFCFDKKSDLFGLDFFQIRFDNLIPIRLFLNYQINIKFIKKAYLRILFNIIKILLNFIFLASYTHWLSVLYSSMLLFSIFPLIYSEWLLFNLNHLEICILKPDWLLHIFSLYNRWFYINNLKLLKLIWLFLNELRSKLISFGNLNHHSFELIWYKL